MKSDRCRSVLLLGGLAAAGLSAFGVTQVRLDALDLGEMTCGAGRAPRKCRTVEGGMLRVKGVPFAHGVGVHAPSAFSYPLGRSCRNFTATVGVDDDAMPGGRRASVCFQVLADDVVVYDSGTLHAGESREIDVPLAGCDIATLRVTDGGDGIAYDHADWCDAVFHIADGMTHGDAAARRLSPQLGILTPPERPEPRINGPKVFGVRPSHPVLFKIPVTGARPMSLRVSGLPDGVTFDPATGVLGGRCATPGDYLLAVTAENAKGRTAATVVLKVGPKICLTPPLGWNSWNAFGQGVSDADVRRQADAMVASGLAEHGWSYVVVDDCWRTRPSDAEARMTRPNWITPYPYMYGPNRRTDADGQDVPNANAKFPDMKGLADYIHARGLKAGLYCVPGRVACCWTWGSFGHEAADAAAFAKWGYDLLKYDWCYGNQVYTAGTDEERQKRGYALMAAKLAAQDRDIVYNVCNYGRFNVTNWAAAAGGHYWRMNDDVKAKWRDIIRAIDESREAGLTAGRGRGWADPDMLVVGSSRLNGFTTCTLSPNEQYTHVSMWTILAAPLFIGCDLTRLDPFTKSLLTNDEVLDIDQDPLGAVGRPVFRSKDHEIWVRPLADGSCAAALFNRGLRPRDITVDFLTHLGRAEACSVRDVWRQETCGTRSSTFTASVPGHATLLYRFTPAASPADAVIARRTAEERARGAGRRGWLAWEAERNPYFPPQNRARVLEIAGFLPKTAVAPGDPRACRAEWDAFARTADGRARIAEAERILAAPTATVPPDSFDACAKTGSRAVYSGPKGRVDRGLAALVYGEALENGGRFLAKTAAYVESVCAEPSWVAPFEGGCSDRKKPLAGDHYIDLTASRTAVLVATAVAWFRDRLPPATVARAREVLRGRIVGTFLKDSRRQGGTAPYINWWMPDRFNWSAVCHNGCVSAILALEDDPVVRAEAVESAERLMAPCFLDGFLKDGYCEEGMGYWNFGFGNFMALAANIRVATGGKVDFCRAFPQARRVATFGARYRLDDRSSPPFADGNGTPASVLLSFINQAWPELYAAEVSDTAPFSGEFWVDGCRSFGPFRFVPPAAAAKAPLPARDWFSAAEVLIARQGGLACAVKGGSNGDRHNHDDAGSYVVNLGARTFAGDPGNEVYTGRTFSRRRYESKVLNSYAHPVPRVGGMCQGGGPAFGARLLKTDFTPERDTVVYDLAGAYPACVPIVELVRTMTFDRTAETVTVTDEAEFAVPTAFESPVIAWEKPVPGVDDAHFTLVRSGAKERLAVAVSVAGGEWTLTEEFIPNPGRQQPTRVAIAFRKPVLKGSVSVTYGVDSRGRTAADPLR